MSWKKPGGSWFDWAVMQVAVLSKRQTLHMRMCISFRAQGVRAGRMDGRFPFMLGTRESTARPTKVERELVVALLLCCYCTPGRLDMWFLFLFAAHLPKLPSLTLPDVCSCKAKAGIFSL